MFVAVMKAEENENRTEMSLKVVFDTVTTSMRVMCVVNSMGVHNATVNGRQGNGFSFEYSATGKTCGHAVAECLCLQGWPNWCAAVVHYAVRDALGE